MSFEKSTSTHLSKVSLSQHRLKPESLPVKLPDALQQELVHLGGVNLEKEEGKNCFANEFSTWIVSGGGVGFMRVWAEDAYGIPPEQTIGSMMNIEYSTDSGDSMFRRLPGFAHVNDGPGKPVGIQRAIGKRPILAVGNSDGDYEMIDWSTMGPGRRLGMFIHHTDEAREWAYDRKSHIGKLNRGLDDAASRGWVIVDMKEDWIQVFSDQSPYTANKEVERE